MSHAPARDYLARRREEGKTGREAVRALKRHLVRVLFRLLKAITEQRRAPVVVDAAPAARCIG